LSAAPADDIESLCERLGLAVSAAQVAALRQYLDLLQRWNQTYNLTAVREREAMLTQHLADCLALIPALQRLQPRRVLDVGSGGGLPGVIIAVLLPACEVTCVDAVGKKMAFVRQVAGALRLQNLHALHARVEALRSPAFDLITSRAFASLADFVALTARHLTPGGVWVAMKGKTPDDELAALPPRVEAFHVEQLAVPGLEAQRCLVWMKPRKTE
jgi:16S rRNA (guanine527-N7)-methyltransferase